MNYGTFNFRIHHFLINNMSRQLQIAKDKYWTQPCPNCLKTFSTRFSFDGHLTNGDGVGGICSDQPNLWSQTSFGVSNNERLIDEISKHRTLKQQMKAADQSMKSHAPMAMADHLLAPMPSIPTLASNAANSIYEMNNDSFTFEHDDNSYSDDDDNDDGNSGTPTNRFNPFPSTGAGNNHYAAIYNCPLPPATMYQVHLERTIQSHRKVDLGLADHINEVVCLHSKRGVDIPNSQLLSRDNLINILAKAYNLHHLKPKICPVKLRVETWLMWQFSISRHRLVQFFKILN